MGWPTARLVHVALHGLLMGAVWWLVRSLRTPLVPALAAVAAVGALPAFVDPGAGAADSGFADHLVAVLLTGVGVALVLRDPAVLAAACGALLVTKPEGMVQAAAILALLWVLGRYRELLAAAAAVVTLLWLWLPIRAGLLEPAQGGFAPEVSCLLVGAGCLGGLALAVWLGQRFAWSRGMRLGLLVAAVVVPGLALALGLLGGMGGALGEYLGGGMPVGERLGRVPVVLHGLWSHGVSRGDFTALFPWLLAARLGLWAGRGRSPEPALGWLAVTLLAVAVIGMVLSPARYGQGIDHFVRFSLGRLMAQTAGVLTCVAVLWSFRAWGVWCHPTWGSVGASRRGSATVAP